MPYRLSALAEQDLDEIWSYVADDASPTAADRLIDAIVDRFELLAEQPRMGRLRPEFGEGLDSPSGSPCMSCITSPDARHEKSIVAPRSRWYLYSTYSYGPSTRSRESTLNAAG